MKTLTKEFDKVEEMDIFIKKYIHEYHPCGYCTTVKIEFIQTYEEIQLEKGKYRIVIERLDSCD